MSVFRRLRTYQQQRIVPGARAVLRVLVGACLSGGHASCLGCGTVPRAASLPMQRILAAHVRCQIRVKVWVLGCVPDPPFYM